MNRSPSPRSSWPAAGAGALGLIAAGVLLVGPNAMGQAPPPARPERPTAPAPDAGAKAFSRPKRPSPANLPAPPDQPAPGARDPQPDAGVAAPPPSKGRALLRGPSVQDPRTDRVTLLWRTRQVMISRAVLTPTSGDKTPRDVKGPAERSWHRLTVTGLRPNTLYHYRVLGAKGRWHHGQFRTAPAHPRPFTFLVYGDCRTRHDQHLAVVEAMLTEDAVFAVNTGDLVDDGAKPKLWNRWFRLERPLIRRLPVYPVLGNHELLSSWAKGYAAFRQNFALPRNGPQGGVTYHFRWGNSFFIVLNSNLSFVGTEQTAWATARLLQAAANPEIRHLFVFVHQSPFASGIHGENEDLQISGLVRTFSDLGVDAVFAGHDHVYERGESEGLRYIVSGGCGAPLYPMRRRNSYTRWFESTAHYVRVTVDGDRVEFTALKPNGRLVDHLKLRKVFHQPAPGHPPRPRTSQLLRDAAIAFRTPLAPRPSFETISDAHPVGGVRRAAGTPFAPPSPVRVEDDASPLPWSILFGVLGLLALAIGLWFARRRQAT